MSTQLTRHRPKVRRVAVSGLVPLVLLSLVGCSPRTIGEVGLTEDESGALIALVAACDEEYDGVTLVDAKMAEAENGVIGMWRRSHPVRGASSLNLQATAPRGWDIVKMWDGSIEADRDYVLYAGIVDDGELRQDPSSGGLRFTLRDIEGVSGGMLIRNASSERDGETITVRQTASDFEKWACS